MSTTTHAPAMTANLLAEHDVPLASVAPIGPTQKYLLRLVLFGAGKTILHHGTICEVLETHDQIRQLLPLVNTDLSEAKGSPFWIPRGAANRRETRQERIRRQYVSGLRRVFPPPHWTGDERPEGMVVHLESRVPDPTTSGGYTSLLSGERFPHIEEQHILGNMRGLHLVQGVPVKHTTKGFFSRASVEREVSKMRTKDWGMKIGITEVVFSRQSPTEVANQWGLNLRVLMTNASRIRRRIRAERGA